MCFSWTRSSRIWTALYLHAWMTEESCPYSRLGSSAASFLAWTKSYKNWGLRFHSVRLHQSIPYAIGGSVIAHMHVRINRQKMVPFSLWTHYSEKLRDARRWPPSSWSDALWLFQILLIDWLQTFRFSVYARYNLASVSFYLEKELWSAVYVRVEALMADARDHGRPSPQPCR